MRYIIAVAVLLASQLFAEENHVVIHRGDKPPPRGYTFSYYEDYPEACRAGLTIWSEKGERKANPAKEDKIILEQKGKEQKASKTEEKAKAKGKPKTVIMDGKEYLLLNRGDPLPNYDASFIYYDDVKQWDDDVDCSPGMG